MSPTYIKVKFEQPKDKFLYITWKILFVQQVFPLKKTGKFYGRYIIIIENGGVINKYCS